MKTANQMRIKGRESAANDADMLSQVRSLFAVISVLLAAAFLYASTVPLVFAVPDYRARLVAAVTPVLWDSERAFDWIVNLLALVPLGFFWSGTSAGRTEFGPSGRRTFCQVALGCLAVATLAESLQFWLPRRVPSVRDLVALETGAIVGCSLWRYAGARAAVGCCLISRRFSSWRGSRRRGQGWCSLFGLLLAFCLAISTCASPSECFEMYRHRTLSTAGGGVWRDFSLARTLLSSTATALVLTGLCSLGVWITERSRIHSAHGLRIFVDDEVGSRSADSPVEYYVAHDRNAEVPFDRAA